MIILGIILLVLGYALVVPILETIGGILVVIGAVLWIWAPSVGGRRTQGVVLAEP
ncbi:hypothetical protein MAUB1S_04653 [Mycolicibacterium aubagnense]